MFVHPSRLQDRFDIIKHLRVTAKHHSARVRAKVNLSDPF
jgi:hypothetical protein